MVPTITADHRRAAFVTIDGTEYATIRCTVEESLDWSPSITATAVMALPEAFDEATFDPRLPKVATVTMSVYDIGGNVLDAAESSTWTLLLRRVQYDWTRREAVLTLNSTDLITQWSPWDTGTYPAAWTILQVLGSIRQKYAPLPMAIPITGPALPLGSDTQLTPNRTGASFIAQVCDSVDCTIRAVRDGSWVVTPNAELDAVPDVADVDWTIDGSTLLSAESEMSLDTWGNASIVEYSDATWTSETLNGPWAVPAVGRHAVYVNRSDVPKSAGDLASVVTADLLRRGEQWNVRAVDHYPLAPGQWVYLTAPNVPAALRQVTRVTHSTDGAMTVRMSLPVLGE